MYHVTITTFAVHSSIKNGTVQICTPLTRGWLFNDLYSTNLGGDHVVPLWHADLLIEFRSQLGKTPEAEALWGVVVL